MYDTMDTNESSSSVSSEEETMEATETERTKIREELSVMSFEDLMKLKEKLGSKVYNKKMFGVKERKGAKSFKRANKNRPREVSSKIKVKSNLTPVELKKPVARDPRFDPLCGTFEDKDFKKNYHFLKDVRKVEMKQLEKELESVKDANSRRTIKGLLQRLENQVREQEKREKLESDVRQEKLEIREQLKKGEKPQFKKNSVKKIESFIGQYEELKKQNRLDKHIDKRTKKLSKKEFKKINKSFG